MLVSNIINLRTLRVIILLIIFIFLLTCRSNQEYTTPVSFGPKVVETHGYIVPEDSMTVPKVVLAGKPKVVKAGKPKVFSMLNNVHLTGKPKTLSAGIPRVCTPGKDSFLVPLTIPAYGKTIIPGTPEIVIAKDPKSNDQNTFNFIAYTKLQGLNDSRIFSLLEDSRGNLWIGTYGGGVCKFDGVYFTHFTEKEGLGSNIVKSILEDKNGNLWFGTHGGGICKYDGKIFTRYTEREGLVSNIVNCIWEDRIGNLWFGTDKGVAVLTNAQGQSQYINKTGKSQNSSSRFIKYTEKEGLANNFVWTILEDKKGNLWFGTSDGACLFDGMSFHHYTTNEGLPGNLVKAIVEDNRGNLWFGTWRGLSKYDGQSFTNINIEAGLSNNLIASMLMNQDGSVWIGTEGGGINLYDPGDSSQRHSTITHFTVDAGLAANIVPSILKDKNGFLWIGTTNGLNKYLGQSFRHFTQKEGIKGSIKCLIEDKNSILWFGGNFGMGKYDGNLFTLFTHTEGLMHINVNTLFEDKNGNLWMGGYLGVTKYDGVSFTHFTMNEGLSDYSNNVHSIHEDQNGNLWFGLYGGGLSKYDGKTFMHVTRNQGLSSNYIWTMTEDLKGNFWLGTENGGINKYSPVKSGIPENNKLSKIENKISNLQFAITHFTTEQGMLSNEILSILEDKIGNLWFGSGGGGVTRYSPSKDQYIDANDKSSFQNQPKFYLNHFTENEGLLRNFVYGIMEDKHHNLWFGTNMGISKLDYNYIKTLDENAENIKDIEVGAPTNKVLFQNFTYEDGFQGVSGFRNSILEDQKGTIWFGAQDRLTALYPDRLIPDTIPPNIQLTGLALFNQYISWPQLEKNQDTNIVFGAGVRVHDYEFKEVNKWYDIPQQLHLAYDNNHLNFRYVGITLHSPKKVRYQYMLQGLDYDWSEWTNQTEIPYTNLSHGAYTFKVKAINSEGYRSKELNYSFTIRPPWWSTWWFRILSSFFILSTIALLMYLWFNYKFRQKLKVELIRQKIAADLHDEIGSNLSSMAFSLELVKKKLDGSRQDIDPILNKLVSNSQETSSLISDTIWSLNPKNDSFDKLKEHMKNFAHDILTSKEIDYQFNSNGHSPSPVLSLEQKRNIYLIYKEAINNIAKHSKASHVHIRIETLPDKLIIEITDNGLGFDTMETHQGNGLNNFKSRSDKDSCEVLYSSIIGKGTFVKITAYYNSLKQKTRL